VAADLERRLADRTGTVWVDFADPTDEETEVLSNVFHFHPLTIDDCIFEVASPKLEEYDGYLFLVIHGVEYDADARKIELLELDAYLGPNYLVTFHYPALKPVEDAITRCQRTPRLLARGSDFVLHAALDALTDQYLPVSDRIDDQLDDIEDRVLDNPTRETLLEILSLKRVVVHLRRVLIPQREVLRRLGSAEEGLVSKEGRFFFRDVYDHLYRVSELAELHREVISSALEAYLSAVSNRLNEIMKVLTMISTLILPLTLITGIYGMNFDVMPELRWKYGYPATIAAMAVVTILMLAWLRRRRWL
jgi:magnesium transporter